MVEEQVQDDVVMRKLFIRGLSNEATKEHVQEFFERFGNVRCSLCLLCLACVRCNSLLTRLFAFLVDVQVEDVTIVMDRSTGRSKGYGFVTFQTMEGAFNSLQEPEKDFDVRGMQHNSHSSQLSQVGN